MSLFYRTRYLLYLCKTRYPKYLLFVSVQYLEYHHPLLTAVLHRLLQYLVVVSNPAPAASV